MADASERKPYGFKGKKNVYRCQRCGGEIVTVDSDWGTTPMFTSCHVTLGCRGNMRSAWYEVDQDLPATHEWYKPELSDDMSPDVRQHVEMGGLLLREIAS